MRIGKYLEFITPTVSIIQYHDNMRKEDCLPEGVNVMYTQEEGDVPCVHTEDGNIIVREGDYIITDINGNIECCKPNSSKYNELNMILIMNSGGN